LGLEEVEVEELVGEEAETFVAAGGPETLGLARFPIIAFVLIVGWSFRTAQACHVFKRNVLDVIHE